MIKNRRFLILMFLTLLFFSLARIICQRFCLTNNLYQIILTDNFHHYQIGVLVLIISLMFWNELKGKWFIPAAMGLIIDELMYLLYWTKLREFVNFHQYRLEGIIFSWVMFLIIVMLTIKTNVKKIIKLIVLCGLVMWILEWEKFIF